MLRYDVVLFDADNTLFDFDAAEASALRACFGTWGFPFTPETEALYHRINRPLWDAYAQGEITQPALSLERFHRLNAALGGAHDPAEMSRVYLAHLAECAILFPDSLALLQLLAGRCKLALVTNGITAVQEGRFADSPVTPYLQGIFISQTLGCQKPEPRFFDLVTDAMGITDRRRVVVVGDTPETDILGGNNAGMDTIWFNPRGKSSDIVPTWSVTALLEIPPIVLGA